MKIGIFLLVIRPSSRFDPRYKGWSEEVESRQRSSWNGPKNLDSALQKGSPVRTAASTPWMVAIGRSQPKRGPKWFCGGALISRKIVITAAHCIIQGKANLVRVGELDLSSNTELAEPQDSEIESSIIHEGYKQPRHCHDVAVLKLQTPMSFSKCVRLIYLPSNDGNQYDNVLVTLTGWVSGDYGKYNFEKLHLNGAMKMKRYGPLVREEVVPGINVLWVFRPEDIAEIFRMENRERGLHPQRRSHLALEKYRTDRPDIYNTGGLLPTNGPDWWKIRREFQKGLSRPQNVRSYLNETDNVVREFIQNNVQGNHEDFLPLLSRLYLELTCLVAFDVKLDSLSPKEMRGDSRSSKLIEAANSTNSAILKLDNGPRLWRFFDTPLYKKLCKAQNFMEEVAVDMVSRKIDSMKTKTSADKLSLLEMYLSNPVLDKKDVVGMACDMLLAGIDTTTNSTSFALYHLAKSPEVQEKLHEEASSMLPSKSDKVNEDVLNKATYTKAVIKETFRMNPISVGVGRILQADAVLSGYQVPKGTVIVTQNQVTCRLEEHFDDPNEFKPERWMRESGAAPATPYNPFLVLPFGHGARSCIARRLAEQNMQILLLRICRDFKFSWEGKDLDCVSLLINLPDAPIKLNFQPRSSEMIVN